MSIIDLLSISNCSDFEGEPLLMKRIVSVFCCLVLLFCASAASARVYFEQEPPADWKDRDVLKWTIFDVDEGDAMLLECGGESMLVDGGPNPFREKLRDALEKRGLKNSMKYILSTHYHDDHIDGIFRLFEFGFTPGEYLHSYNEWAIQSEELLARAVKAAQKNNVPIRRVQDGDTLTLGGADIRIFQCTTIKGTNARSLMLKVTYGESTLLLCADIIGKTQRYFLDTLGAEVLNSDLIKLPHHAITPAVPEFLDAVSADAAVATNVKKQLDNKSVAQLETRPLPALYSGDGTVYAVTDGVDWYLYQTPGEF